LLNPIQIFREDTSIEGFRINFLYGLNANLKGFDLGVGNGIKGDVEGVEWGFAIMLKVMLSAGRGVLRILPWLIFWFSGRIL